jgi:hypothetical protein
VNELTVAGLLIDKVISSLFGESLKVTNRATIGGNDPEQLTAVHLSQRFLGFENRERAVQATAVNLFVDVHPAFPFVCARF